MRDIVLRIEFAALLLLQALMLAGCEDREMAAADRDSPQAPEVADNRPVLVPAGLDVVPIIQGAGKPWVGAPLGEDSNYTASVDLTRRNVYFSEGSLTIDRANAGGIYYLGIRSGIGDRCGDFQPLVQAYIELQSALDLPTLATDEISAMRSAWEKRGDAELNKPGVQIKAVGGCIQMLTFKATQA